MKISVHLLRSPWPTQPLLSFVKNSFCEIRENLHRYRWHFQYPLPTSSCQRSLWMPPSHIFSFFAQSDENQRKGAKAIARSRGVFMIVDHLSSSLNLFRIVTIYLWFSNLICFALQVSHTIRTFILYWGGYIYQGYLSDICTHMQTSKHILLCSF